VCPAQILTAESIRGVHGSSLSFRISLLFHPTISHSWALFMPWFQVFQGGPEYEARRNRGPFNPPNISLKHLHDAVPRHLFERSTSRSVFYVFRHIAITYVFYQAGSSINSVSDFGVRQSALTRTICDALRPFLWLTYWGWQGIAFAGLWCLGELLFLISRNNYSLTNFVPQDTRWDHRFSSMATQ